MESSGIFNSIQFHVDLLWNTCHERILSDGHSFCNHVSCIFSELFQLMMGVLSCACPSMLLVTISVDKAITNKFVIHSFNLPIKVARIHDDEEVSV